MIENIMVAGILCAAIFLLGRSLFKTMTDRKTVCGCSGDCGSCTYSGGEKRSSYSMGGNHDRCGHPSPETDEKYHCIEKK